MHLSADEDQMFAASIIVFNYVYKMDGCDF